MKIRDCHAEVIDMKCIHFLFYLFHAVINRHFIIYILQLRTWLLTLPNLSNTVRSAFLTSMLMKNQVFSILNYVVSIHKYLAPSSSQE